MHDLCVQPYADHLHEQARAPGTHGDARPERAGSPEGEAGGDVARLEGQAELLGEDVGGAEGDDAQLGARAGKPCGDFGDGAVAPGGHDHAGTRWRAASRSQFGTRVAALRCPCAARCTLDAGCPDEMSSTRHSRVGTPVCRRQGIEDDDQDVTIRARAVKTGACNRISPRDAKAVAIGPQDWCRFGCRYQGRSVIFIVSP